MKSPLFSLAAGTAVFLSMVAFGLGGCSNPPIDPMIEAVELGERPVAMRGEATFTGLELKATVTISRGLGRGVSDLEDRRKRRGIFGNDDDLPSLSGGGSEEDQRKQYEDYIKVARLHVRGAPMPPVTMRLILENTGATEREIEIREVNSDLGNFAVRPDKLKIASAQKSEPDPMISQLGVTNDEIPVKVTLRVAGKTESQTILVKNLFAEKPAK